MSSEVSTTSSKRFSKIVKFDEGVVRDELQQMVRGSVEDTLNQMLEAEADQLCNASRYERSDSRKDTRAGHYNRKLTTSAGDVNLKMPKLRQLKFETAIIERYQRRESSVEEAMMEMYLSGVSVRRVEDITQALWGTKVSSGTVSNLNKKIYKQIDAWRNLPIHGTFVYVYLDGICLKRCWSGSVRNVSVLVAIGVDNQGHRHVLGVCEGAKEDKSGWLGFLRKLKTRGLNSPELIISDKCLGLVEALGDIYPKAKWQRCVVHFYRNVFSLVPKGKVKDVAAMLKAIHAQEDHEAAMKKARDVQDKLGDMRLGKAAELVETFIDETLQYMHFPREHWQRIRTNNPLERIMREIRRRSRVVGAFPDGESALMLAAARLRHIAGTQWSTRRYLDMDKLAEMKIKNVS